LFAQVTIQHLPHRRVSRSHRRRPLIFPLKRLDYFSRRGRNHSFRERQGQRGLWSRQSGMEPAMRNQCSRSSAIKSSRRAGARAVVGISVRVTPTFFLARSTARRKTSSTPDASPIVLPQTPKTNGFGDRVYVIRFTITLCSIYTKLYLILLYLNEGACCVATVTCQAYTLQAKPLNQIGGRCLNSTCAAECWSVGKTARPYTSSVWYWNLIA
jgi:hypothetical protein